ncbi:hypothetical protein KLEB273_gp268 [Bacillus phage vB_BauM_KLEB27-3]|nr:hypothetical protein KLEB273_gp268 [Bacillus phage vB_BauM_KLEB27-3]
MSLDSFANAKFSECVLAVHLYDPERVFATHLIRSSLCLIAKADDYTKVSVSPFYRFLYRDTKWTGSYISIGAISDDYSLPISITELSDYRKQRRSYCKVKMKRPITHIFQLFSFTKKYNFSFVKDDDTIDYLNEMIIFPILILQKNYPATFEQFYPSILESVSFLHRYMKKMYTSGTKNSIMKSIRSTNRLLIEYIKFAHNAYLKELYEYEYQMDTILSKYNQAIDEKVELWKNNN